MRKSPGCAGFGKPLVIAVNKADQYDDTEIDALVGKISDRYDDRAAAVVAISAGGSERYERTLADGRRERVERERAPTIVPLVDALERLTAPGASGLEPAREAAVLAEVGRRGDALAREVAARESAETVAKYTRRAIIGALAAVAPGSDILIQGALGTALVRELARINGVPVRELDVEALLARLGLTVRNTTAIVLAIAGNALKAFPGLGTLGGGMLHAVAYGLVFDSVGRALAATLARTRRARCGRRRDARTRAAAGARARSHRARRAARARGRAGRHSAHARLNTQRTVRSARVAGSGHAFLPSWLHERSNPLPRLCRIRPRSAHGRSTRAPRPRPIASIPCTRRSGSRRATRIFRIRSAACM